MSHNASCQTHNVDFTTQGKIWWEELGRTVLGTPADSFSVTFTPKRFLTIIFFGMSTGGSVENAIRLNNDSGNNYSTRSSTNGAADATGVSANRLQLAGEFAYDLMGGFLDVINIANLVKTLSGKRIGNFSGTPTSAGSAPDKNEWYGKWANTSNQINRVDVINTSGTGDYAPGSTIVVLGHD